MAAAVLFVGRERESLLRSAEALRRERGVEREPLAVGALIERANT